ncbi:MAG TPA: nucleoside-diphosphate sugar epimerase/dehydratase [Acidimicrobiales bacterium]|nr:nucleoside-diphosphate sugar epimerase/dehydratase [Acidimicrobiales bacterium]
MSGRALLVWNWARTRTVAQVAIDGLMWAVALSFATAARYDFAGGRIDKAGLLATIPLAVVLQLGAGLTFGLYAGRWRFGSFEEVAALAKAAGLATVALFAFNLSVRPQPIPRSAALGAGFAALVLMAGARYLWRLQLERMRRPTEHDSTRLLVFGAGEGGAQVITAMLRDPDSPYFPVGLLDDDPRKRNLRINGVSVVGGRRQLEETAQRLKADALLIAIPSADSELVAELTDLAAEVDLNVKILPSVRDLFGGAAGVADIRDIDVKDFLGRHQIETDMDAIAGYLTAKRVLVTGAGGSIGSELCRQISRFGPAELIMLDCNEAGLHAVELSLEGRAMLDNDAVVLADIRDTEGMNHLFEQRKPEVVFHAAALKHLPLLERTPGEAVKTNVWGTLTVLEAAAAHGVERFVNISTDKAADPSSVLGYTKRIAERLTAHFAAVQGQWFLSVRFGNVLGSSGSVLTTFRAQLQAGGPLTVTDPEVTRYFMTVEEAVELVIQAGAIGRPGEVLVLDMGEPVRIADVALRLASQAERTTRVVYTGLRPGEKLHEVLLGAGEADVRPIHKMISHVPAPALCPLEARTMDPREPAEAVIKALQALCADHDESVSPPPPSH